MSRDNNLMKFICPLLAALATVVALFGPWFSRTTESLGRTRTATLLEVLQGTSFVEYTSQQWLWVSGAGVLLVLASAVVGDHLRKRLAGAGSVLMLVLPGWSLINVYADNQGFDAGWGLWVTAAITIAIVVLARKIPEEDTPPLAEPQIEQR